MTFQWTAKKIARIVRLPQHGVLAVLEFYLDDSGTHGEAPVVIWGGVVGTVEQFEFLEEKWNALLENPLPGKPPLEKFHLTECRGCRGEFEGYSRAESDRVQYLFRQIIIESGLMPVAYGTDTDAWNKLVVGPELEIMGEAERCHLVCV